MPEAKIKCKSVDTRVDCTGVCILLGNKRKSNNSGGSTGMVSVADPREG